MTGVVTFSGRALYAYAVHLQRLNHHNNDGVNITITQKNQIIKDFDYTSEFVPMVNPLTKKRIATDDVIESNVENQTELWDPHLPKSLHKQVTDKLEWSCHDSLGTSSENMGNSYLSSLKKTAQQLNTQVYDKLTSCPPDTLIFHHGPNIVTAEQAGSILRHNSAGGSGESRSLTLFDTDHLFASPLELFHFENVFNIAITSSCILISTGMLSNAWVVYSIFFS